MKKLVILMLVILSTSFVSQGQTKKSSKKKTAAELVIEKKNDSIKTDSIKNAIVSDSIRVRFVTDSIAQAKRIEDSLYKITPKLKPTETITPVPFGFSKEDIFKIVKGSKEIVCYLEKAEGGWQKTIKISPLKKSKIEYIIFYSNTVKKKLKPMDSDVVEKRKAKGEEVFEVEKVMISVAGEEEELVLTYMDRTGGTVFAPTEKQMHPYLQIEIEMTRLLQQTPESEDK